MRSPSRRRPTGYFGEPASEPVDNRGLAIAQVEQGLHFLQSDRGRDESALWRLCKAIGWLARDLPDDERQRLVHDSIAEGARGEIS